MKLEKYDNETVSSVYFDYAKEKIEEAVTDLEKEIEYIGKKYVYPKQEAGQVGFVMEFVFKRLKEVSSGIYDGLWNIENILSSTDNEDVLKLLVQRIGSLVENSLILNGLLSKLRIDRDDVGYLMLSGLYSVYNKYSDVVDYAKHRQCEKVIHSIIGSGATIENLAKSLGVKNNTDMGVLIDPFL